jgi:hypothetical protein
MKIQTIHIINQKTIDKIKRVLDDKAHIHKKIREGKMAEIDSRIKFVKPVLCLCSL